MASEDEKVPCPVCGYKVGTKEEGTKLKVHKVDGEKCEGSDELVNTDEPTTDGIDKGQSYEALESPQDVANDSDAQNDDDAPTEPETDTQGVASSTVPTFTHTIAARKPCPYLNDAGWHTANGKMAYTLAGRAGLVPTAEAKHINTDETATHYHVTYAVPVK